MLRILSTLSMCVLAAFICACGAVLRGARRRGTGRRADVIIVLGAAVQGEDPSPVFARRIEQAVRLYESERAPALIFTGGRPAGAPRAESEVAMSYARRLGVPVEAMRCETRSTSTWTNLVEALAIMDAMNATTAVIVSDALHLRRAMAMASALSMRASPSPSRRVLHQSRWTWVRFWLREGAALLHFWAWHRRSDGDAAPSRPWSDRP